MPGVWPLWVPPEVRAALPSASPEDTVAWLCDRWLVGDPLPLLQTLERVDSPDLEHVTERMGRCLDRLVELVDPLPSLAAWLNKIGPDWEGLDAAGFTPTELVQAALEHASSNSVARGSAEGPLPAMFIAIRAVPTHDAGALAAVVAAFSEHAPAPTDDPFQTLMISASRAFVDRTDVRARLKEFVRDEVSARVMVVNDDTDDDLQVGKSYIREFLAFLVQELDLGIGGIEIRRDESGGDWTPRRVAEELVLEFGGDPAGLPGSADILPGRWHEKLAKHILRGISAPPRQTWIVLDRFSAEHLPPETFELVMHLGSQILSSGRHAHLRLLLLDFPRPPLQPEFDSDGAWRKLIVQPLTRSDVRQHLVSHGIADPDTAVDALLDPLGDPPWDPRTLRKAIESLLR